MNNTFKKGLILGGVLSVAVVVGLFASKKGRELTEELKADLVPLLKKLKKNLGDMKDVTKDTFDELAANIVEEYGKKKGLADDAIATLTSALQDSWKELEAAYADSSEE